ncbi:MAG: large conductance mechanosensitive channel protein MscL [Acidimicrobiales bacterium]
MKNMLKEFKEFLSQGDIVVIAVGLVMALTFKSVIDALLEGVIHPIIAAIFGKPNLSQIGFDIGDSRISIGLVLNALIELVVVAFVLFLILKAWEKMKARSAAPSGPAAATAAATEVEILTQIRDELRAGR